MGNLGSDHMVREARRERMLLACFLRLEIHHAREQESMKLSQASDAEAAH